jgi:hypothetical protein
MEFSENCHHCQWPDKVLSCAMLSPGMDVRTWGGGAL